LVKIYIVKILTIFFLIPEVQIWTILIILLQLFKMIIFRDLILLRVFWRHLQFHLDSWLHTKRKVLDRFYLFTTQSLLHVVGKYILYRHNLKNTLLIADRHQIT